LSSSTILLVGHCGPDAFMLRSAVRSIAPDAAIHMVDDDGELTRRLQGADLVLVNRVLDGDFPARDGVGLIAALAPTSPARFMLVSNYPEAQARAEAAGAVPGFGKADTRTEETRRRIESALASKEHG
jgi:hypothetical protein